MKENRGNLRRAKAAQLDRKSRQRRPPLASYRHRAVGKWRENMSYIGGGLAKPRFLRASANIRQLIAAGGSGRRLKQEANTSWQRWQK